MTLEGILLSIEKDATKSSMNKLLKALRKAIEHRDFYRSCLASMGYLSYYKMEELDNKRLLEILEGK